MPSQKRDPYWDNVKGILILLVVFAHFMNFSGTFYGFLSQGIYLFHMPLFIFVSGIFYKDTNLKQRILGLTIIGIVYNVLLIVIDDIFLRAEEKFYIFRATKIPWFVFCVALCSVITYILKDCGRIMVLAVAFFVAVVACYDAELMQFCVIAKTVCWFPMFYLGHILGSTNCKQLLQIKIGGVCGRWIRVCGGGIALLLFGIVAVATKGFCVGGMNFARLFGGTEVYESNSPFWMLAKCIYYLALSAVSICVLNVAPTQQCGILTKLGRNSLQIYFWHIPIRSLVYALNIEEKICVGFLGKTGWALLSMLMAAALSYKIFSFPVKNILDGVKKEVRS